MFNSVKDLLSGVPTTENDKVVSLRAASDLDPPPAFLPAWRRARQTVIEMDKIRSRNAQTEMQLAEATKLAHEQISKGESELQRLQRQYDEEVELIVKMQNGELRMGIETKGGGE